MENVEKWKKRKKGMDHQVWCVGVRVTIAISDQIASIPI
jgi:hypothetical protein